MKVLIIGGTGLLGSAAAEELISKGHQVVSVSLPPLPAGAFFPRGMEICFGNYLNMPEAELRECFSGCEGFVFAAGVDERVEVSAPVYEFYETYNIRPLERLLRIAKECGVKHVAICGSYFSWFAKTRTELKLEKYHPYIRSRREQEELALSFAGPGFDVAILELPYIFGVQPGRKPVWVFLVEMLRKMKGVTFWPKGGTAMVTVKQAGQAIAGALERNCGGNCYPIGYFNMTWRQMLSLFHDAMGCPRRKIVTVTDWMFAVAAKRIETKRRKRGVEGGLFLPEFVKMQCSEQFIDRSLGCDALGVQSDDIERAIGESVRLSLEVLNGEAGEVLSMPEK